jgi:hypothetical protein
VPGAAVLSGVPWARLSQPFVFSTTAADLGPPPVAIRSYKVDAAGPAGGATVALEVLPKEPSLLVSVVLPVGITPARTNLPGLVRSGRWTATYVGAPPEGISWHASFDEPPQRLAGTRLALTVAPQPGAGDGRRLPSWLPQERAVWTMSMTWVLDPAAPPPLEPVPPLR